MHRLATQTPTIANLQYGLASSQLDMLPDYLLYPPRHPSRQGFFALIVSEVEFGDLHVLPSFIFNRLPSSRVIQPLSGMMRTIVFNADLEFRIRQIKVHGLAIPSCDNRVIHLRAVQTIFQHHQPRSTLHRRVRAASRQQQCPFAILITREQSGPLSFALHGSNLRFRRMHICGEFVQCRSAQPPVPAHHRIGQHYEFLQIQIGCEHRPCASWGRARELTFDHDLVQRKRPDDRRDTINTVSLARMRDGDYGSVLQPSAFTGQSGQLNRLKLQSGHQGIRRTPPATLLNLCARFHALVLEFRQFRQCVRPAHDDHSFVTYSTGIGNPHNRKSKDRRHRLSIVLFFWWINVDNTVDNPVDNSAYGTG